MSADIIPFPGSDPVDEVRLGIAMEVADFATRRIAETIGTLGLGLDDEVKVALLLACAIIEDDVAQDGAA